MVQAARGLRRERVDTARQMCPICLSGPFVSRSPLPRPVRLLADVHAQSLPARRAAGQIPGLRRAAVDHRLRSKSSRLLFSDVVLGFGPRSLAVASLPALGPLAPPAKRGPSLESIYRVSLTVDLCEGNKIISFKTFISPQPVGGLSKRKNRGPWARAQCAHWLRRPWSLAVLKDKIIVLAPVLGLEGSLVLDPLSTKV